MNTQVTSLGCDFSTGDCDHMALVPSHHVNSSLKWSLHHSGKVLERHRGVLRDAVLRIDVNWRPNWPPRPTTRC